MSLCAEQKLALLDAFVSMYGSRIVAAKEYHRRFMRVAMITRVAPTGRIVPDMKIEFLERDALLDRLDTRAPGVPGAMSLVDSSVEDEVPVGLIFTDGDALFMKMRVARVDRND